jgi:hypothetical protein
MKMEKMNQAIQLCEDLFVAADQDDLVKQNPERAAALLEVAGLLHGTLEEKLAEYMAERDQCYMPFVAACDWKRCLLLCQGNRLEMAY